MLALIAADAVRTTAARTRPSSNGRPRRVPRATALAAVMVTAALLAGCGGQAADRTDHTLPPAARDEPTGSEARRAGDEAGVRDVVRRWISASLAGDATAMCALVDPARLRYLEDIGTPCETLQGGTLTAESERDVRSTTIASVDIEGSRALAHTRSLNGTRDIELRRVGRRWLIRQF